MNVPDESVEELVEEFLAAYRRGTAVDVKSFASAHPQHAAELCELIPMLLEMERYGESRRREANISAKDPPDLPGSDYRLLRRIGAGGMGTVWEAIQISLNRKVAVKVIAVRHTREETWRERFSRESRIVGQLHHPNIVKVYGAGTAGDLCFYAMELIDGIRFDKVDFHDRRGAVRAVLQAAKALAYAHSCGVVHRDIKPANLMLDASGEVRMTDFGLASALSEECDDTDARNGTLRYMAPERLKEGTCSFAADQYALGVTLWELLSKRHLFAENSGAALFRRICTDSVPRLTNVDADLAAVVAKSTAPKAQDRYRDVASFADDLQRWLERRSVAAAPPSPIRRLALWARRHPGTAAAAAAALLGAIAFAASLAIGYAKTSAALQLAAQNAALADEALGKVFRHVEGMTPSRRDTELLSVLMPYYDKLAEERELTPERIDEIDNILGTCAYRSGEYERAELAFRRLVAHRPSAKTLNHLADTLRRRGHADEANAFAQRVADEYSSSTNMQERHEAARALETLSIHGGSHASRRQAYKIAKELLDEEPDNPDFRFLHARLLAESPGLENHGNGTNTAQSVFSRFSDLVADYPDRPEYARALVSAMERRLRTAANIRSIDRTDVELALDTADRLLGRFPNSPDIVSSVVTFRDTYSAYLRKLGDQRAANREILRTTGMLELLSHNAESPDAARLSFKASGGIIIPYRQITVASSREAPATLVLALHDRARNGTDNVRQTTAPFLRTMTTHAERIGHRTVILLPQCPPGRDFYANQKPLPDVVDAPKTTTSGLSKHFDASEFVCHCCGRGADMIDPRLIELLEQLRVKANAPIHINCGYRCPKHNAEVGGVPNSQHVLGTAADIYIPAVPFTKAYALAKSLPFDAIGSYPPLEQGGLWFLHLDVRNGGIGSHIEWQE